MRRLEVRLPSPTEQPSIVKTSQLRLARKSLRRHWQLHLLILPPVLYFIIFKYIPITNAVIAFKNYKVVQGIFILNTTTSGSMDAQTMLERQQLADLLKYSLIVVSSLPVLIIYPFVQRYFTKGILIGAVKG